MWKSCRMLRNWRTRKDVDHRERDEYGCYFQNDWSLHKSTKNENLKIHRENS